MPWAVARSASSLPTAPARSTGAVVAERSDASSVEAAASVLPATSSMSWAWTWRLLRKTASRGRADVPDTFLRTRAWRRIRAAWGFLLTLGYSFRCLSCLLADVLALVADTLLLVGVELALEALGHADHHVGDQGAGEPVQGAVFPRVGRPDGEKGISLAPELDDRGDRPLEGRLRAPHADEPRLDVDVDAAGDRDGHPSDTTHASALQLSSVTRCGRQPRRPRRPAWPRGRSSCPTTSRGWRSPCPPAPWEGPCS